MKITKKILQDIIKEELEKVLLSENSTSAETYKKTIKSFIKFKGVEGALVELARLVGTIEDRMARSRDEN